MSARASVIPVFVPHLGCPQQCVFCDQRRISGQLRPAGAEDVHRIVREAGPPRPGQCRELAFYGGSFTAIPEDRQLELLEAARQERDRGQIQALRLSTRPDAVDKTVLDRLRQYGVETIELGVQSMDDRVLALSGRGHTAAQARKAAGLVRESGFRLILQMMTGLPGDTGAESLETARELIELRPDGVRIYPTVILRGTALEELWHQGRYHEHSVDDAVALCARILPLFQEAGIPVIRLGLNPTEDLSGGEAVGGAYDPALGERVLSRIWLEKARSLLAAVPPGSRVVLAVPETKLSQAIGQRRCNLRSLEEEFSLRELRIRPEKNLSSEISLISVEKSGEIS